MLPAAPVTDTVIGLFIWGSWVGEDGTVNGR